MALLKKTMNIGFGLLATAGDYLNKEKISGTIDSLAARGEGYRAEGCTTCQEFKEKRKQNIEHIRELARSEKEYWMPSCKAGFVERQQYEELLARVEKLEASV